MITKINRLIQTGLMGCAFIAAFTACTDTWDDHYEAPATGVNDGSLWQAIKANPDLSNFASVIEACGYDKALASSQVFTVFAPTNASLSADEAAELIRQYNNENGKVSEEDNTVIKEFLQNHIALYNYSVSPNSSDSIVLMNGKYAVLSASHINETPMLSTNALYENGVLFTVGKQVAYFPNLFEYLRKDADLDSLRKFLYCGDTLNSDRSQPIFYYKDFLPSRSIPGGIENGKTVYLDSVFAQRNELFNFLDAQLNSEDSTYWMVAPTNDVWRDLIAQTTSCFNYADNVEDRDSLIYTNSRLAIVEGTIFSSTINPLLGTAARLDSVMSTSAVTNYTLRRYRWGSDTLCYYQYFNPTDAGGVFDGATPVECSNGRLLKASTWNFDKAQTFGKIIIVEAERASSIKEVSRRPDSHGDSIGTITPTSRYVESTNAYYNKVSNNGFVEFVPASSDVNHYVTFNITNVLSDMGYDIYLVTAPALANDSNATEVQRLPTTMRCTLGYNNQAGRHQERQLVSSVSTNDGKLGYSPDAVNWIKLADNYKFEVSSYGLEEENPQVTLKVETRVSNAQQRNNQYTRTMRIDCIVLKPHEE